MTNKIPVMMTIKMTAIKVKAKVNKIKIISIIKQLIKEKQMNRLIISKRMEVIMICKISFKKIKRAMKKRAMKKSMNL
jgi:hypothetical protein